MVKLSAVRLGATFPFNVAAVVLKTGLVKLRAGTATPADWNSASVPLTVGLPTRYEKATVCARPVPPPFRHSSPTYEMSSEVMVAPVLFWRRTPQKKFPAAAFPEPTDPSARSVLVPVP